MSIDDLITKIKKLFGNYELDLPCTDSLEIEVEIISKLNMIKKYQQLEADGRLVELPLEAYCIVDFEIKKGFVSEATYCVCRKPLLKVRYDDNSLASHKGYLGNTVFLTKAEAEKKLAELRGAE